MPFKSTILQIISFKETSSFHWIIFLGVFILVHMPAIINDDGHSNTYSLLAESLCRGELNLSQNTIPHVKGANIPNTGDLIFYNNKYYLPYPPAPALIIIPFLYLSNGYVNSVLICVLLTCLNFIVFHRILKKLGVKESHFPWLLYGFFFGTSYWYVLLSSHHVYGFAEIVAVTFILLLLNELFGKCRGILLGIFLGAAFLSRQFTIMLGCFILGYFISQLALQNKWVIFIKKTFSFIIVTTIFISIYLLYNYERFGNPLETGYRYILFIGVLKDRVDQYGVFSYHYVLYNLYNYLFKGFNIEFTGNGLLKINDVDPFGTALLVASPFIIAAFKTGWSRILRISGWITIIAIFTGLLFYHNNGKNQVNASRFTLDFLPLLFILVSLGAKNVPPWIFKSLVIYAIVLNVVALIIHACYHSFAYY